MKWPQALKLVGLFLAGWAGIAAASDNPSQLTWDWMALNSGLLAAGLTVALVPSQATLFMQILATVGSFFLGWGTAVSGLGFRYVMWHFDFRALVAGLAGIGLVHSGNPNVTGAVGAAVTKLTSTEK